VPKVASINVFQNVLFVPGQVTATGDSDLLLGERPKNNKKDLYDAEEELKSLHQCLKPLF
jgi:hypothetical protein